MKVRIFFACDPIEIDVPEETDLAKYLLDNAWELVKQLVDDGASIYPESWEEVDEEEIKK